MLQRMVDAFDGVCRRRKLRINIDRSKIMVFERTRVQTFNSEKPYSFRIENPRDCNIWLGEKEMKRVNKFKYLGTVHLNMAAGG